MLITGDNNYGDNNEIVQSSSYAIGCRSSVQSFAEVELSAPRS